MNTGNAFAQNEYLDYDPVWKVHSQCSAPAPCIQDEEYNYYIAGDTIFNGLTYKKIFKKGIGFYSWLAPPPPMPGCSGTYSYINSFSDHFVRSSGKQMYIRTSSDTIEYLLYDFDLQVGDSLPLTFNNYEPLVYVTAIDSFYTPYGFRKRFVLSGMTWSYELLEGIGHSRGLFEPMNVPLECGFMLTCISLNDTAYYPVTGTTCELALNLPETHGYSPDISVYPNPAQDKVEFKFNALFKNGTFTLFDIQQRLITELAGISGYKFIYENEKLDSGVYFFKITDHEKAYSGKIVINK